eukprot:9727139-Alexandrium_andersonii.AAC.1
MGITSQTPQSSIMATSSSRAFRISSGGRISPVYSSYTGACSARPTASCTTDESTTAGLT